jgi:hypothetical protein
MVYRFGSWLYRISDRLLMALFLGGVLVTPFFQAGPPRAQLHSGTVTTGAAALFLGLCLAWRSLLRRDFVWLAPARLTWADASDARIGQIGRRLWVGWLVRLLAVAYVTALAILLLGGNPWLPAGYAVFGGVGVCAVALARRRRGPVTVWLGNLVVLGLAALAGLCAVRPVGSTWLWVVAGAAVVGAVVLVVGSGSPRRPSVAACAGRDELVRGYLARLVRRVSVTFGDALALLPASRPIPWTRLLAGRAVVVRFALFGVLARAGSLVLSLLLVIAAAVLHRVFPLVDSAWVVGAGAYFAALPCAATLAQLRGVPSLRRWLGCTDMTLRLVTAAVVLVVVAVWFGLVGVLGVPVTGATGLAAVVAVGAVVRTVGRPALDYGNVGVTVTPDGNLVPVGLIVQLVRGPEVLVIGLLVAGSGLPIATAGLVVAVLAGFGVLR